MMKFYFAYGSNMNPARLKARGVEFLEMKPAVLKGYRLTFNKICRTYGSSYGCATIEPCEGGKVEGILFELEDPSTAVENLDLYEGYPTHYDRIIVEVETDEGIKKAFTYIANPWVLGNDLLPHPEYLAHLLVPCKMGLLSEEYCRELKRWKLKVGE
jgi:gamma-glutamylcyclotransferase